MALRGLVEGRGDDLALHGARHVGDLLRALVDQQHDQVALGMVALDRAGDVLQDHRLAGARRRDDQRALALAERGDQIDHPVGDVLLRVGLQVELFVRVERGQVVEIDPVLQRVRRVEVDLVDLEQREIALPLVGRADLAVHRVAGAQRETANLRGADVDVVGAGQVVRFGRAQEAEAVLHDLQHAGAVDRHVLLREALQDREHDLLLAQRGGVLDVQLLGVGEQIGRRFGLQFLQVHEVRSSRADGARTGAVRDLRVFGGVRV